MHTQMKTRPAFAVSLTAAAVTAAGLTGCVPKGWEGVEATHRRPVVLPLGPELDSVDVETLRGRIDIGDAHAAWPAWATDIARDFGIDTAGAGYLVAVLQSEEEDRLDRVVFEPHAEGNRLHLHVDWPAGDHRRTGDGVEYIVRLDRLHAVDASNDFGDMLITLTHANSGPVAAETDFGDIVLRAGRGFAGSLDTGTDFGEVRFPAADSWSASYARPVLEHFGKDGVRVRFGDGPKSTLYTDFGDITLSILDGAD